MNKSKQKGTAWETAVVNCLRLLGFPAKRKVLSGSADKGDVEIEGVPWLVIECKNAKRYSFAEWIFEAETEAQNAGADIGIVWAHQHGKSSAENGYIVMSPQHFAKLLRKCSILEG